MGINALDTPLSIKTLALINNLLMPVTVKEDGKLDPEAEGPNEFDAFRAHPLSGLQSPPGPSWSD